MTSWLAAVVDEVGTLALAATLPLLAGTIGVVAARRPATRQAWAEWSAGVAVLAVVLAAVPLPRLGPISSSTIASGTSFPPVSPTAADERRETPASPTKTPLRADDAPRADGRGAEGSAPAEHPTRALQNPDTAAPIASRTEARPRPAVASRPAAPVDPAGSLPAAPPASPSDVRPALVAIWSAGTALLFAWLTVGALRLSTLLRRSRPADAATRAVAAETWRRIGGAGTAPRLVITGQPIVPFACGIVRPTVALPDAVVAGPRPRLVHVLRHEFAHVLRGDLRGRRHVAAAAALLWWHPLVWWLRARARRASEAIADDLAARETSVTDYARDLLSLCELPHPGSAALAAVSGSSELSQRIHMLLNRSASLDAATSRSSRALRTLSALVLLGGSTALLGVPGHAQDRQAEIRQLRAQSAELEARLHAQQNVAQARRAQLEALQQELSVRQQQAEQAATAARQSAEAVDALRAQVAALQAGRSGAAGGRAPAATASDTDGASTLPDAATIDPESVGGDHRDPGAATAALAMAQQLVDLRTRARILASRLERIRPMASMGQVPRWEVQEAELELAGVEAKSRLVSLAIAGERVVCEAQLGAAARARAQYEQNFIPFAEFARQLAREARANATLALIEAVAPEASDGEAAGDGEEKR